MKLSITLVVAVGLAIGSCSKGRNTDSFDEISGAYFKEYSFKVVNPETGAEIGMRTVRDTIFIKHSETDYEVSNRKWRLNDYDIEGWKSMEHDEDRPMPTFLAKLNSSERLLNSQTAPDLFLRLSDGELFKDKGRNNPYKKLQQ